jgi:hypothetical protein
MACSWASYRRDRVNIAVSEWDRVTKIESSPETHNLRTREPTNATDCGRRPVNANDILESLTSPKTYQSFTPLYQLSTLLSSTSQLASATVQFTRVAMEGGKCLVTARAVNPGQVVKWSLRMPAIHMDGTGL